MGRAGHVENDELRLEEDVTVDREANTGVALDTTETSCPTSQHTTESLQITEELLTAASSRSIGDVRTGDNSFVASDAEGDARKSGRARIRIASLRAHVLRSRDFGVVGADDCRWEVQQRSSGVGNGINRRRGKGASANGVPVAGEFPKAIGGIDGNICDASRILGAVDVSKVVAARGALLQVGSEERRSQGWDGVAEERLDLVGGYGIDGVHGQTQQSIIVGVFLELSTDGLCKLHCLAGDGGRANLHGIQVDVA